MTTPENTITPQTQNNIAECITNLFIANNKTSAFVEMLQDSPVFKEISDHRARDTLKLNAEVVKSAIEAAQDLIDELDSAGIGSSSTAN